MRHEIIKLSKGHSTKAERRFLELLKKSHIPFQTKVKIGGKEIDFLIGDYAIEIDSHEQNIDKNCMLVSMGYKPIHYHNWEINDNLLPWLEQIWQGLHSLP